MNQKYNVILIIFILILFLYKGVFINILSYINLITHNNTDASSSEVNLLKQNIDNLTKDLEELKDNFSDKEINYSLTRLSYKDPYNKNIFYIYGGINKSYKEGYLLINNLGVVGIITKVYNDYSKCLFIKDLTNLPIEINNITGNISEYKDNLFKVTNISNYDSINLNDSAYTIPNSKINTKLYIGYVYKIDKSNYTKTIYIKSNVDFNNITYLHVVGE